jgi:hypothetical protein
MCNGKAWHFKAGVRDSQAEPAQRKRRCKKRD